MWARVCWLAAVVATSGACASGARPLRPVLHARRPEPLSGSTPVRASAAATVTEAPPPELYVRCEDRAHCPNAVGMLVVADTLASEPERCTVSLIAPDRVLSASHCLSPAERHPGAACAHTWVSFPATADAPAETIACARVLFAAPVLDESALHQEHAVLQLARAVGRTSLAIDPAPPEPGSIVTVVSVTPHPVYGSTHALTTRLCEVIDSQPAQDALGAGAANVGWLASCPIARGNSGSPVLDYQGRIRAIVHGGTSLSSAFAVTSAPLL